MNMNMNMNTQNASIAVPFFTSAYQWVDSVRLMALTLVLLTGCLTAGFVDAAESTLNINMATAEELSSELAGIGLSKAYRIVEYREVYGPFETIEELAEVKGIGPSTVERNRLLISIE